MLKLTINDHLYVLEFRHITKSGKRRQLYGRAPIKAVTTCVIAAFDLTQIPGDRTDLEFIAIDNSICALDDNFSRREGRKNALRKVLRHCGALKGVKQELWDKYLAADPRPDNRPKRRDTAGLRAGYFITEESIDGDILVQVDPPERKRTIDPLKAETLKTQGQEGKFERRQAHKQHKRDSRTKKAQVQHGVG